MEYPNVTIIILNWNGWKDTIECLESLYQIKYPNYNVIVADNGSDDESIQKIKDYCSGKIKVESPFFKYNPEGKPITLVEYELDGSENKENETNLFSKNKLILIKNNENYGFAKGNNIAVRYALNFLKPEYILLLNNDTVIDNEFLLKLVEIAGKNEKIGIVGPKVLKYYDPQIIDSTGHILKLGRVLDRGHEELDKGQYDNQNDILGAIAACSLYKTKMLTEIGLLDESFFTGYEDAELSWRSNKNGWKARYVPKSIVYHKRGKSLNKKSVNSKMVLLQLQNMVRTAEKYGNLREKLLFSFVILADLGYTLKERLFGRNNVNVFKYINLVIVSYFKIISNILKSVFS
jgi:GT2 family glycosyltransferase